MTEILKEVRIRSYPLGPTPATAEASIKAAISSLKNDLQRERDLKREGLHRALIIALHTDSHWEKAKWR